MSREEKYSEFILKHFFDARSRQKVIKVGNLSCNRKIEDSQDLHET